MERIPFATHQRDAFRDRFQIHFHSRLVEWMEVLGQLVPNPFAKPCRLTVQETLQVDCHRLDRGAAVNGDFRVQLALKPAYGQPG